MRAVEDDMFTKELEGFWEADHYAIDRGNAAQLFPRLGKKTS
jgi:hypothetical protein